MQLLMHCPMCQARVSVPPAAGGKVVRCPRCKGKFRVPRHDDALLEETVNCWLDEGEAPQTGPAPEPRMARITGATFVRGPSPAPESARRPPASVDAPDDLPPPVRGQGAPVAEASGGSSVIGSAGGAQAGGTEAEGAPAENCEATGGVAPARPSYVARRHAAGASGVGEAHAAQRDVEDPPALVAGRVQMAFTGASTGGFQLAFAINLLNQTRFRASMPMVCCNCGEGDARQLIARPVAWIDKVTGNYASAAELESHYALHIRQQQRPAEVLADMRPIEELSAPFNNPLPYFVCHRCAAEASVRGQTLSTPQGVICEVIVPTGGYALAWLGRVNGVCGEDYARLEGEVSKFEDDSWRGVPEDVRKRLSAWFDFQGTERFVGYFPDSDFGRREHGLAGIVLTDQRLVSCKYHHHGCAPLSEGEPLMAVKDGSFYQIVHHRHRVVRLRREDAAELSRLLEEMGAKLRLSWT